MDHDITELTFLGLREELTDLFGSETLQIEHTWKEHSKEEVQGDSTGTTVLCWDVTTDLYRANYIYLGYRIRKSKTYSEFGWEPEISGLDSEQISKELIEGWTKLLTLEFNDLGLAQQPKLFKVIQEDIG